jgi:hypothetical protein
VKPLTEPELSAIAAEAKRLGASGPAVAEMLGQTVPRLLEELRAAQRQAATLGDALEKERAARDKAAAPPSRAAAPLRSETRDEAAEAMGTLLAAPFRVSAKAAAAARTDPLSALAVQVAKALAADASPVERARLIAMAFAATQGDLETFWAARRQRKAGKADAKPIRKPSLRTR